MSGYPVCYRDLELYVNEAPRPLPLRREAPAGWLPGLVVLAFFAGYVVGWLVGGL